MSRHAKLHDALPEEVRDPIRRLIQFEAEKYARATMRKGTRKFQWAALAAIVFISGVLVYAELSLIAVALVWWPAYIIAGLLGGFCGALISYGFQQLFKYEDGDPLAAAPEPHQETAAAGS